MVLKAVFNPFTSKFDWVNNLDNPLQFKGDIGVNTDFPLIADVKTGWFYTVSDSVTDNAGATYTNTGQSFVLGDEIAWNGVTWVVVGNKAIALVDLTDVDDTDKAEGKILKVDGTGKHVYVDDEIGTDEKVKYDIEDPTAGYVADKIIAGSGISVAEGTAGNENKLVITNDDKGSDVNLSSYAKLTDIAQDITANSFVTDAGTSSDFVKGDGSLDSTTYVSDVSGLVPYTGATGNVDLGVHEITASNLSGSNTGDQSATDFDIKDLTDSTSLRTTWSAKLDDITGESIADLSDVDSIVGITNGKILKWDTNKFVVADAPDTSPAGSNTEIQFNDNGVFGASSNIRTGNLFLTHCGSAFHLFFDLHSRQSILGTMG